MNLQANSKVKNLNYIGLHKAQKGVALVMVLVVLLAMTILGVAATDSSNLQALMARNNQFRMEAFNASNTEIEAQIDFFRATTSQTAITPALNVLIRGDVGSIVDSRNNPGLVQNRSNAPEFQKEVDLTYNSQCVLTGEQLNANASGGVGVAAATKCFVIGIDSRAEYESPNIGSDQLQTINFFSL